MDLKLPSAPAAPPKNLPAPRAHPRFVSACKVELQAKDPSELRTLWTSDISKGGLFVASERLLSPDTEVEVALCTPDGKLALKARVVHVIDEKTATQIGHGPGVGLQFIDLTPPKRDAIDRYVNGIATKIAEPTAAATQKKTARRVAKADPAAAVRKVARLFQAIEGGDYYDVLGLCHTAPDATVREHIARIRREAVVAIDDATPPQAARLRAAVELTAKMQRVFSDRERRAAYDFRHGHVRAEARIAQSEIPIPRLREIWRQTHPERARSAKRHIEQALRARAQNDFESAVAAAERALEADPFYLDIRRNVEVWRKRNAEPSRPPPPSPVRPKRVSKKAKKWRWPWAA